MAARFASLLVPGQAISVQGDITESVLGKVIETSACPLAVSLLSSEAA